MPAHTPPAGSTGADTRSRRRLGAFYTPPHTVHQMVAMLRGLDPNSRILEPSGGDGAFVRGLLHTDNITADQVDVWDADPAVGPIMSRLGVQFTCRDSLLDPPPVDPTGYTHVIGNPPYLNKQSQYIKTNRVQLRRTFRDIGANDTYAMFIHLAVERLRPGGQLVFLVSDTFLTLGVHRKLREHLLASATIDSITLLPTATFPDAAVRTAILNLTKSPAPTGHVTHIFDARTCPPDNHAGAAVHRVPQAEFATNPGAVFAYEPAQREALTVTANCRPLLTLLDGGLGMYTGDNGAYLGVVSRDGRTLVRPRPGMPVVDVADVDGTTWRYYHKRGGSAAWWQPAEHCVRWDPAAQAQYGIPATAVAGRAPTGTDRPGLIVSGVASRLTARLATPGALWESNKAFGLFPKDPDRWPVEFFLSILNSTWYNTTARALNHTVSLQARDLQTLPLLAFRPVDVTNLAALGLAAVDHVRSGRPGPPPGTARSDAIVDAVVARTVAAAAAVPA